MKRLITLLMLVAPLAFGANLTYLGNGTFGWDRSPDDLITNGVYYRLYAGTNLVAGSVNNLTNTYTGTNVTVTVTNLAPATWYFSVTATQGGLESTNSNVLPYFVPALPPRPPGKMFMIYLQSTLNFTNWENMGNFRAVLQTWP